MTILKNIIILLRPYQWCKNVFIFLPLFFGGYLFDLPYCLATAYAFFSFSLAASSIYCFNDILDADVDCHHPSKNKRPIAAGIISPQLAYTIMGVCILSSISILAVGSFMTPSAKLWCFLIIVLYLLMNIAYCLLLKKIAIVDVFTIALGFVLRIIMGGKATGIVLSKWIVLMTFLLALFLAFSKRRDDVIIFMQTRIQMRKSIDGYNVNFLNQAISVVASVTMVCYLMYTVSNEVMLCKRGSYLYFTSIFVLAGIMRYLQLTFLDFKSGSPTQILMHDRFMQLCVIGWLITFGIIIY